MKTRSEQFVIICAIDKGASTESTVLRLRDVFDNVCADYWEFLNPGTFVAYFRDSNSGELKAQELIRALSELSRDQQADLQFAKGLSRGQLIAAFDSSDRITQAPMGLAVNEAMRMAREHQDP
jgi:hypothetical protein